MQIVGINCIPREVMTTPDGKVKFVFLQERGTQDTPTVPFCQTLQMYYTPRTKKYKLIRGYSAISAWEHRTPIGTLPISRIRCVENSTGTFFYDANNYSWSVTPIYTQSGDVITVEFSTLMNSTVFPDYPLITDVQVVIENGVKNLALTHEHMIFHKVS